jgi:N utilization substance protein B
MVRREARKRALELLYQIEVTGQNSTEALENFEKFRYEISSFSRQIIEGVIDNKTPIDELIDLAAARWTIKRMPLLDRNILRIAIYEILYEPEIPVSVSINEAVELAKIYGTPESSKFVNGVLGNVAKRAEKENESKSSS